jgi:hypothetical protein
MWGNHSFKYRIMPPRRRPLYYDINHVAHHSENSDEDQPPPQFNDGVHPALMQFMVDTKRHFADAVS